MYSLLLILNQILIDWSSQGFLVKVVQCGIGESAPNVIESENIIP